MHLVIELIPASIVYLYAIALIYYTILIFSAAPFGVTMITATANDTSIFLSWMAVDFLSRNGPNLVYNVTLSIDGDTSSRLIAAIVTEDTTAATIGGLKGFTTYRYVVTTQNIAGAGPSSTGNVTTLEGRESLLVLTDNAFSVQLLFQAQLLR